MLMIGRVEFAEQGRAIEARLGDDGRWSCAEGPAIADRLNRACAPPSPPTGDVWGHLELIRAAQLLRGLATLGPPRPPVPG